MIAHPDQMGLFRSRPGACRRCDGTGTLSFWHNNRGDPPVEIVGGKNKVCDDCGGSGEIEIIDRQYFTTTVV